MNEQLHTCSLYCERPECIKAQRDELREKLAVESARLEWCLSVLYSKDSCLTTDVGCGHCCGHNREFDTGVSAREAVDTMLRERLGK